MEDARLTAGSREVTAALKGRYVPPHLRGIKDVYIPSISEDPVAKAKARRASLGLADVRDDLGGLGGPIRSVGALSSELKRKGSALAAVLAASASGAAEDAEKPTSATASSGAPSSVEGGAPAGATRHASTNAVDVVVQRLQAGDVRRASVLGDSGTRAAPQAAAPAPIRSSATGSGGMMARGPNQVGASVGLASRPRVRRSGLANAQERAARMSMNT